MASKIRAGMLVVALLLGGCASAYGGSPIAMPSPSPGDTEGQIMSVTGNGFTLCSIADLTTYGVTRYDVAVCGSVTKARSALDIQLPQFAKITDLQAYKPGDGGSRSPQSLVMQFWIDRTTGAGFEVTGSQILDDGTIDVGISGDLKAALTVLDREFPGRIKVHAQADGVAL